MATVGISEDRSFSIGRVFNRAFSVMGKYPLAVFGVAFLVGALPQLVFGLATSGLRVDLTQRGVRTGLIALGILGFIVALVLQAMIQGVIVHTTLIDREGRRATVGESVGYALSRAIPLILVSILFALGLGLGLMLLIVPFFFLATRWAVVPGTVVAERSGVFGAFSRSAELTEGARWKVLGLGVLVVLVAWLISAVAAAIDFSVVGFAGVAAGAMAYNPVVLIVGTIANTITSAYWSAMQASLYVELRDWKDGPSTDRLAEIFR